MSGAHKAYQKQRNANYVVLPGKASEHQRETQRKASKVGLEPTLQEVTALAIRPLE